MKYLILAICVMAGTILGHAIWDAAKWLWVNRIALTPEKRLEQALTQRNYVPWTNDQQETDPESRASRQDSMPDKIVIVNAEDPTNFKVMRLKE